MRSLIRVTSRESIAIRGLWSDRPISVPVRARQRLIGVIQAIDEAPQRFDADALRLVELLATAAAIAIENARLFRETRQRADRLAVLTEISTAINQPVELNAVVQAAVSALTRTLHLSQTGLALFDETRQHLVIMADVPASGSLPVSGVENSRGRQCFHGTDLGNSSAAGHLRRAA